MTAAGEDIELVALRRWLILGEETETAWMPDWYPTMAAADACHCPPWEIVERSVYWRDKALIYRTAVTQAQNERRKQ